MAEWTARVEGDSLNSGEFNSLEARLTVDPQNAMMDPFDGVQIEWSDNGTFTDTKSLFYGFVEAPINPENLDDFQDVGLADLREFLDGCEVIGNYPEQDAALTAWQIMRDVITSGQVKTILLGPEPSGGALAGYTVGAITGNYASVKAILDQLASFYQQGNSDPLKKCLWGVSADRTFFFGVRTVGVVAVDVRAGEAQCAWQAKSNRDAKTRVRWMVPKPAGTVGASQVRQWLTYSPIQVLPFKPISFFSHLSSSGQPAFRVVRKSANALAFQKKTLLNAGTSTSNITHPERAIDGNPNNYAAFGGDGLVGQWEWTYPLEDVPPALFMGLEVTYTARGAEGDFRQVLIQLENGFYQVKHAYDLPKTDSLDADDARVDLLVFHMNPEAVTPIDSINSLFISLFGGGASGLTPTEGLRLFDIKLVTLDTEKLDAYATYFYEDPGVVAGQVEAPRVLHPPKHKLTLTRADGSIVSGINIDHYQYQAQTDGNYGVTVLQVGQPDDPDRVAYWASVRSGDTTAEINAITSR